MFDGNFNISDAKQSRNLEKSEKAVAISLSVRKRNVPSKIGPMALSWAPNHIYSTTQLYYYNTATYYNTSSQA